MTTTTVPSSTGSDRDDIVMMTTARLDRYTQRMREVVARRRPGNSTQAELLADRVLWAIRNQKPAVQVLPPLPRTQRLDPAWVESVLGDWWWESGYDTEYLEAGRLTKEQREAVTTFIETVGPLLTDMAARLQKMSAGVADTEDAPA